MLVFLFVEEILDLKIKKNKKKYYNNNYYYSLDNFSVL